MWFLPIIRFKPNSTRHNTIIIFDSNPYGLLIISFTLNLNSVLGDTFEISSFFGAEFWRNGTANATSITLFATTDQGINLSEIFTLDTLLDGSGGIEDFQKFTVSAAFQNLTSAKFVGNGAFSVDDIYGFTADEPKDVPEPTTLAIFALGLIGLGSRKFKK